MSDEANRRPIIVKGLQADGTEVTFDLWDVVAVKPKGETQTIVELADGKTLTVKLMHEAFVEGMEIALKKWAGEPH